MVLGVWFPCKLSTSNTINIDRYKGSSIDFHSATCEITDKLLSFNMQFL